jgi:hypothetical protein
MGLLAPGGRPAGVHDRQAKLKPKVFSVDSAAETAGCRPRAALPSPNTNDRMTVSMLSDMAVPPVAVSSSPDQII